MLRAKAGLPALYDEDDLPDPIYDPNHVHVLTEIQQRDLHYREPSVLQTAFLVMLIVASHMSRARTIHGITNMVSRARHTNSQGKYSSLMLIQ